LRPGDKPEDERAGGVLDVAHYQPARVPAKKWIQLIQKVWEVDLLACPRCGGEMKIIALIEEPAVVERILKHLELWREGKGNQRSTAASDNASRTLFSWPCLRAGR
jgi:hypothetical protein